MKDINFEKFIEKHCYLFFDNGRINQKFIFSLQKKYKLNDKEANRLLIMFETAMLSQFVY